MKKSGPTMANSMAATPERSRHQRDGKRRKTHHVGVRQVFSYSQALPDGISFEPVKRAKNSGTSIGCISYMYFQ